MLVNLNDVLLSAKQEGYAVGLFNTVNLEMARAVIQAAETLRLLNEVDKNSRE